MSKLVYNFKEFLAEAVKFDVHGFNKNVRDPEYKELRNMGVLNTVEPAHHKYLHYLKMEVDDAKRLMDDMNYDSAIMALEEAESMLKMLKKAVEDAFIANQEENQPPDEEEEQVTEEEEASMKEYWDLVKAGVLPEPDFEDFKSLPSHAKWVKWIQDDGNFMMSFLKDGNFKMVKHYVNEIEWLLGKLRSSAEQAAAEQEAEAGRKGTP